MIKENIFDKIFNWAVECYKYPDNMLSNDLYEDPIPTNFIAPIYLYFYSLWETIDYRVFHRGVCALKGCDERSGGYGGGGYLPDDCYEWWCNRCAADGINYQVNTVRLFYGDDKIRDFILALKGK
jgi:hypothetical protein